MKFYFREEEAAFLKSKPKGFVRQLVIEKMNGEPEPQKPESVRVIDQRVTCRYCSEPTFTGYCRVCGRLQ